MSGKLLERACIVIPGIDATNYKMWPAAAGFAQQYTEATVLNSPISADTPDPRRSQKLRERVRSRARIGLTFVLNSLGTGEVDGLTGQDEAFLNDPSVRENVRTVLMGPSGLAKGVEKIVYAVGLIKNNSRLGKGIHSLSAFPPENIAPEDWRRALRRRSHADKGYSVVEMTDVASNKELLTPEQQAAKSATDVRLEQALREGRYYKARRIIRQRGGKDVVGIPLRSFYESAPKGEKTKRHINEYGRRTLRRAAGTAPLKELQDLIARGYEVDCFVADYDIVPPKWLARLYPTPEEARRHIRIMPGMTHDSILFQARSLAAQVAKGDTK